jgi:hypothetical protein
MHLAHEKMQYISAEDGIFTALPSLPSFLPLSFSFSFSLLVGCLFMGASKLQLLVLTNYLRDYLGR